MWKSSKTLSGFTCNKRVYPSHFSNGILQCFQGLKQEKLHWTNAMAIESTHNLRPC